MESSAPPATIVVPTFQEAENLAELVKRLFSALAAAGRSGELIIVDDNSGDGTDKIVQELAKQYPVRLIVRTTERGLSSAVLAGMAEAKYDRFVVLDADLQHPPEMVPALLDLLDSDAGDFVVGTRYGDGGGVAEQWSFSRRLQSSVATAIAKPLADLSDPMSGFFALRRETWERADKLDPIGYKIGLELFVKCRCLRPVEVPIQFQTRNAGASKLGPGVQLDYIRHLLRLYRYRFPWLGWLMATIVVGVLFLVWILVQAS